MTYLESLQDELKHMENKLNTCESESKHFISLMIRQIKREIESNSIKTEENTKK